MMINRDKGLQIEHISTSDLIPYLGNAKAHPEPQIAKIAGSIKEFGFLVPILLDADNGIIAGHGRYKAAKLLKMKDVPCVRAEGLTGAQKKAFRIADNQLTMLSGWLDDALSLELEGLKDLDFDLDLLGFDAGELDNLLSGNSGGGLTDPDDVPEVTEAITKPGDLWLCGEHRVLCGDATKREDVERLMDGEKADMVFTDPPYGIDVVKNRQIGGGGPVGGKKNYKGTIGGRGVVKANQYKPVYGDDKPFDPSFLFKLSDNLIIFGGNYFANKLPESRGWLVWDKIDGMEGTTKNFSDFEMAWTSFNKPARLFRHRWQGLMKGSEKNEKRCHPTQKPVQVCVDIIEYYGDDLSMILDPFLGSGSTLIACEKTNHKCYGLEIDPHYVDVIIKRYEDYTGNKAELS